MQIKSSLRAGLAATLLLASAPVAGLAEGGGIFSITDQTTKTECSACHMAYAPALLPKRSWHKLMSHLDSHFGEDASLDPKTTDHIRRYLEANAADTGGNVPGIMRGLNRGDTPERISELPIMVAIHGEVGRRWRKKVGSMGRCNACHRGAENGVFGDD